MEPALHWECVRNKEAYRSSFLKKANSRENLAQTAVAGPEQVQVEKRSSQGAEKFVWNLLRWLMLVLSEWGKKKLTFLQAEVF